MILTKEEIVELTDKHYRKCQREVLNALGVDHKVRPDGSLVVRQADVDKAFDGKETKTKKTAQPNWDALENA